jgi:hypothetical protein
MKMKAIVLYQPWATLVAIGAKPIEFRNRDYRARDGIKVGQRVAVAAGARPVKQLEVEDLLRRLDDEENSTGLDGPKARLLLRRWLDHRSNMTPFRDIPNPCPLGVIVCTATIGEPMPSVELMPRWASFINDSDRLEHAKWGWPMQDVRPIDGEPIRSKGAQGFFWVSVPDEEARE